MDITKRIKIKKLILVLYMGLFPFGQVPMLLLNFLLHNSFSLHPTDFLIFLYVVITLVSTPKLLNIFLRTYIFKMLCVLTFSFLVGVFVFNLFSITGVLYLLRLTFYFLFAFLLWTERPFSKQELRYFLIITALFISLIGLFQYFFVPDTRFLKILGWDDHYYRLISTFLDPAYTAILLVFSILYVLFGLKTKKIILKYIILTPLIASLLLTYSRSGYLAFGVGIFIFVLYKRGAFIKHMILIAFFLAMFGILPKQSGGEGVNLTRTASIFFKAENIKQTFQIWEKSPVFGVGYDNICKARNSIIALDMRTEIYSHSCSGADNSILFVLATGGIASLLSISIGVVSAYKKIHTPLFLSVLMALFVHTQFTNTLFYPWVFVWLLFLGLEQTTKDYM